MKSCPECFTQYEDHVPACLVDGTLLGDVASLPSATPRAVAEGDESEKGGLPIFAIVAAVLVLLLLLAGGALVALSGGGTAEAPAPEPVAEVAPEPEEPPAPTVLSVGFTSDPEGAIVTEGGTALCTTPCSVDHPEFAPLPRTFLVTKAGYDDTEFVMNNPQIPQLVKLTKPAPAPTAARPRPRPRPAPAPVVPRPTIGLDR